MEFYESAKKQNVNKVVAHTYTMLIAISAWSSVD